MSEFQYYEFQAIDRPLDAEAQRRLRQISTRARITAHSLVNTYQWGDFKGDPRRLVEECFDLFVYWANWGSRKLMFRLPRRFLDPAAVQPYRVADALEARPTGDFVVLEVQRHIEDPPGDFDFPDDEAGSSAPFAALRADLMGGDWRGLYLGWLLGVQDGLVDDAAPEPPRPPGLAHPSGPLSAFVTFFDLDPDLLAAAAEDHDGAVSPEPAPGDLAAFIADLPEAEKTALLCRAVLENDLHIGLDLRRRWMAAAGRAGPEATADERRRTAGDLLAAAERHARERARLAAEQEATERAQREARERLEREHRLDRLAGREDEAWREVGAWAESKRPAEYDRAAALLKDLEGLAARAGRLHEFGRRLQAFRERHRRKTGLLDRIQKAGLTAGG